MEPNAQVRQVVRTYILEELLPGEESKDLKDDTPLVTGGVIDSISIARLSGYLEEFYHMTLKSEEVTISNFDTVTAIVLLLEKKIDPTKPRM